MTGGLEATTRRRMLADSACGFGLLALAGLCGRANGAPRTGEVHFPPRIKRIVFLFMQGGPSQVDTFDPKPRLQADHGRTIRVYNSRHRAMKEERLLGSPWKFRRRGESGQWVSELFPHVAGCVDDLCFVKSMHTEGVAHGPATLCLHTGATNFVRPSVGAWILYGLGSENENLPGFVSIAPSAQMGGARNYSSAFLPPTCQATVLGRAGAPASQATVRHLADADAAPEDLARRRERIQYLNRSQIEQAGEDEEFRAVLESYELAYRMQTAAPEAMDVSRESAATRALYGIDEPGTDEFGRLCLLARRCAEQGVRYIQVNYSDNSNNPRWDQHSNLKQHEVHAQATDKPVAGLLTDLKARGLLEDTLVWWGGEFGRTPFAEKADGRDHNPTGFTMWLAGGGVRAGTSFGETDEFGQNAVVDRVHMHDLHATLLHLLGLDHTRLTHRHAGRDFRLTDVYGRVVHEILA